MIEIIISLFAIICVLNGVYVYTCGKNVNLNQQLYRDLSNDYNELLKVATKVAQTNVLLTDINKQNLNDFDDIFADLYDKNNIYVNLCDKQSKLINLIGDENKELKNDLETLKHKVNNTQRKLNNKKKTI